MSESSIKTMRDEIAIILGFDAALAAPVMDRVDAIIRASKDSGRVDGLQQALDVLQNKFKPMSSKQCHGLIHDEADNFVVSVETRENLLNPYVVNGGA